MFSLFNIWLSYLLLLRISLGALLLMSSPSSYQRVAFLAEKPRHTSGPSLARHPTSPSDHFFIYLTEILHMEHGGHNKGGREEKQDDEKLGGR